MARSQRSGHPHPRLRALGGLVLVLPLTGALLAALLVPWVVGPGLAASTSAQLLAPLPVALTDATPPGNTVVLAADGSVITYFYRNNRTPVGADRIADVMEQALVDIEDERFYEHNGLDVQGTLRALARNLSSGDGSRSALASGWPVGLPAWKRQQSPSTLCALPHGRARC